MNFKRIKSRNCSMCQAGRYAIFKSYNTLIAVYDYKDNKMYKDSGYYSMTTSKQFSMWCREELSIDVHDKNFKKNILVLCSQNTISEIVRGIENYGNKLNLNADLIKEIIKKGE